MELDSVFQCFRSKKKYSNVYCPFLYIQGTLQKIYIIHLFHNDKKTQAFQFTCKMSTTGNNTY
jgi:hypothetical protein